MDRDNAKKTMWVSIVTEPYLGPSSQPSRLLAGDLLYRWLGTGVKLSDLVNGLCTNQRDRDFDQRVLTAMMKDPRNRTGIVAKDNCKQ